MQLKIMLQEVLWLFFIETHFVCLLSVFLEQRDTTSSFWVLFLRRRRSNMNNYKTAVCFIINIDYWLNLAVYLYLLTLSHLLQ